MRRVLLTAVLGSFSLIGCGPKEPAVQPSVVQMPPAVIKAPRRPIARSPTNEIGIRFPYDANEEVTTLGFSDLKPLAQPEVAQALAANLAGLANEIAGVDRACVDAIVGGAKEMLIGSGQRGWVVVLSIPDHKLETICTPSALAEPITLEGTTKAWSFKAEQRACATTPGWLACGFPALVRQALTASGDGLVPVSLEGDEIITIDDRDTTKDLKFILASNAERLSARVDLLFDADDEARKLHEMLASPAGHLGAVAAESKATPEQKALLERAGKNLVASHRGPRAMIRVDMSGPLAAQAKDLGDTAGVLSNLWRNTRARSKTEEARTSLNRIADSLAKAWDSKDPKSPFAGQTKLVSLPAVPKTVPKGERVTSPADSWKPWSIISWSLETPTAYQLEIIAAKDGQTADIVAHGDLDGNGKASTFTRHVRIDKTSKQLMIEDITATDPDE